MIDVFADLALAFSNILVIVLILMSGFFLLSRALFFQAMVLNTFDIVVNVALKGTFKIPLSVSLGKVGYAFPSGHMQLSTVFYVWLMLMIPCRSWRVFVIVLLPGIAFGLIHYEYHTLSDVSAGFFCGLILVGLFRYGVGGCAQIMPWLLLFLASILMIYNGVIYPVLPSHVLVSYGVLLGLILTERMVSKNGRRHNYWASKNPIF